MVAKSLKVQIDTTDANGVRWGTVDVSYVAPQAHKIINVALHREYSPSNVFIFLPREEGSLSYLRLTH
jgi:hypothetical protein